MKLYEKEHSNTQSRIEHRHITFESYLLNFFHLQQKFKKSYGKSDKLWNYVSKIWIYVALHSDAIAYQPPLPLLLFGLIMLLNSNHKQGNPKIGNTFKYKNFSKMMRNKNRRKNQKWEKFLLTFWIYFQFL